MAAAVWSADLNLMYQFPARYLIQFFHNHGLLSVTDRPNWYVIKGGSKTYVTALTDSFKDKIRLSTPVTAVKREKEGVVVTNAEDEESYDAVFFACHSDQALRLLAQPTELEQQVLGAIMYQENEVILHTDTSILPKRKTAWAAGNMNILQGINSEQTFCVTLNNATAIDTTKILKRLQYHHPIYTQESVAAQARQSEINTDRLYFCGAYWRYGFHEDGVVSALNALEQFKRDH